MFVRTSGVDPIRAELFSLERLEQHAESLAAAQTATFAVNLFDANESNITPNPTSITLGSTQITTVVEAEIGQREYWTVLALLGLLFLLIEWYAYHRRLRAPTVFRPLTRREA